MKFGTIFTCAGKQFMAAGKPYRISVEGDTATIKLIDAYPLALDDIGQQALETFDAEDLREKETLPKEIALSVQRMAENQAKVNARAAVRKTAVCA